MSAPLDTQLPLTKSRANPPGNISFPSKEVLEKLRIIYKDVPLPYRHGVFNKRFHLSIPRPNYKYDGKISHDSVGYSQLQEWYENGDVAGYGDMESLETKVDAEVRDAREIPAGDFTVDPELVELVRETWAEGFIPGNVRAEPYKIHIYGPGGHFRAHRDTPEEGLVGTFLVGLGDWRSRLDPGAASFRIGDLRLPAYGGFWVAFHPDVPHAVGKVSVYRAVLAFKIFRARDPVAHEAVTREEALVRRVGEVLNAIRVPYGVLLEHRYHMGVQGLNGFDAILLSAAEQRPGTAIHVFPVLISTTSEVYHGAKHSEYDSDMSDEGDEFSAQVISLTDAHVDILATDTDEETKEKARARIKFLERLWNVPFFSRAFEDAGSL